MYILTGHLMIHTRRMFPEHVENYDRLTTKRDRQTDRDKEGGGGNEGGGDTQTKREVGGQADSHTYNDPDSSMGP